MPGADGTSVVPSTSGLELGSNLMEVVAAVGAFKPCLDCRGLQCPVESVP